MIDTTRAVAAYRGKTSPTADWTYWGVDAEGILRFLADVLVPWRLSFALQPNELGVMPEHSELWDQTQGGWVPR